MDHISSRSQVDNNGVCELIATPYFMEYRNKVTGKTDIEDWMAFLLKV